jgi:hypothetical protein
MDWTSTILTEISRSFLQSLHGYAAIVPENEAKTGSRACVTDSVVKETHWRVYLKVDVTEADQRCGYLIQRTQTRCTVNLTDSVKQLKFSYRSFRRQQEHCHMIQCE